MPTGQHAGPRILNRKASHNFELIELFEAGLALTGSEVKSLREGKASLDGAFAVIRGTEVWLRDCDIQPYPMAGYAQHKPKRDRKLLLHRAEIRKLLGKVTTKGLTLVPTKIYFSARGFAKVEFALARGKKFHDKRETIKKRDTERDIARSARRR